eukprot:TRINITY_DN39993_c0_g1_i3.p2 TRINITY_DN39993_c0_g1~~TRINITY_DN39993_c0_g1_i3.p2  ORF type:complete len:215 (+),score=80.10 TRINITY_DN39993_c0_g1_i3:125-769(+)
MCIRDSGMVAELAAPPAAFYNDPSHGPEHVSSSSTAGRPAQVLIFGASPGHAEAIAAAFLLCSGIDHTCLPLLPAHSALLSSLEADIQEGPVPGSPSGAANQGAVHCWRQHMQPARVLCDGVAPEDSSAAAVGSLMQQQAWCEAMLLTLEEQVSMNQAAMTKQEQGGSTLEVVYDRLVALRQRRAEALAQLEEVCGTLAVMSEQLGCYGWGHTV